MPTQLLLVTLNGADLELLLPLAESGDLPFFARAFRDGTSACPAPCLTNADCPTAAPQCAMIDYYTPSGVAFTGRGCLPTT